MRPKSAKKNDPRNLEDAVDCNDEEYKEGGFDDDETADGDLQSADETRQGGRDEFWKGFRVCPRTQEQVWVLRVRVSSDAIISGLAKLKSIFKSKPYPK